MLQQPVQVQPVPFASPHWRNSPAPDDDLHHDDLRPSLSPFPRRLATDGSSRSSSISRSSTPLTLTLSTDSRPNHLLSTPYPFPSPSPSRSYARSSYLSARPISASQQPPRTPSPYSPVPRRPTLGDHRDSWSSSMMERVLAVGEAVGEGLELQGEVLRAREPPPMSVAHEPPLASEFEVVRRLGSGSYAVVYLVREVLARRDPSDDGHVAGRLDLDDAASAGSALVTYGREFAIKCLSKANLDEEALEAQMAEVTIHQSLPTHPNIVTLLRTFETSSFLLLLLEFVPGEDLFYFLEQARDHYGADTAFQDTTPTGTSRTPPTPSLLSSLNASQLLSRTRLRLIASMFHQMCEAVAACHDVQVFHRDIKPENFIVTDAYVDAPDGSRERKVVVKLTDFGLSTTDLDSSDMDCGSAPYMSFECRNNIAPTYKPRAADVWSLGIVLINMLYHFNPWTDAALGVCSSFELYREQPVSFFMQRFTGMTLPVAEFLATRVFNILGADGDDSARIGAREFGIWVKDLPTLMCPPGAHKRVISTSSIQGHALASLPNSRPASRHASISSAVQRTPALHSRSLSRSAAGTQRGGVPFEVEAPEQSMILEEPTIFEEEPEDYLDEARGAEVDSGVVACDEDAICEEPDSRAQSNTKRRKRGARKGKNAQQQQPASPVPFAGTVDLTLDTLAFASQALARELSKQSKVPSLPPTPLIPTQVLEPASAAVSVGTQAISSPPPPMVKKASKWKLGFGRSSAAPSPTSATAPPVPSPVESASATASNVSSLIMGLNAPPPVPAPVQNKPPSPVSMFAVDDGYGRRMKPGAPAPPSIIKPQQQQRGRAPAPSINSASSGTWSLRNSSPSSVRSGRQVGSSASSTHSSNWRSSMSSAATSTSAFTRYSNGSRQSVSTVATSVSADSWRSSANASKPSLASSGRARSPLGPHHPNDNRRPRANVKIMHGIPWELHELPRQMHAKPEGVVFGQPPQGNAAKPARSRKAAGAGKGLEPISESGMRPAFRTDASTSTTDLSEGAAVDSGTTATAASSGTGDGPKKVQKGQINALAKMLSALRR